LLPELIREKSVCYARGNDPITANKTGEWRFMTPIKSSRLSPCRQGCLLDGEIPLWLEAVKKEKWNEAWQIMRRNNPFPALTGYVCFHPCSENCNRGQLDQELDIRAIEKAVGEWRLNHYERSAKPREVRGRVAVVGSGPAGLSCAYYLTEAGYEVTVFERASVIGGMLALGIPEYRLPRKVLGNELAILQDEGIKFVSSCDVGNAVQLAELYEHYTEVFVATGAWLSRQASIDGEECMGVWNALDFLSMVNSGKPPKISDQVVVIGGGNAAIDSARTALRMSGVNGVSLIYRRSKVEMPAETEEVEAAEREGVEFIFNALPRQIEKEEAGLKAILLDHSKTGREGLIVDRTRSFSKNCGTVIMALGQEPDYSVFGSLESEVSLFAGGDLVTGPATVPEAIRAGRMAAMAIKAKIEGLPAADLITPEQKPVSFEELNMEAGINLQLQQRMSDPVDEAGRCLGCGTCNSCGICYLFCPDMAVDRVDGRYQLNLDYCKGCGICAKECPAQALVMEGGRL
jgi:NADPH-dependent glutamate synthase beta subunit-like oxidoreductase/Pyruvate/2-oxoacid:ferredoxin oxidoreductase delta subunit